MVGNLEELMDKYDNNNVYLLFGLKRFKFDKNIGFYNFNVNLFNLGEVKDLSFIGKMSLVSDKKVYGFLVYDKIDDIFYGLIIDYDLYINFFLIKDNDKFKLNVRYDYLYDMDLGFIVKDLMLRNERIGVDFLLKENGLSIFYDKRRGDDYRNFSFWEEDINILVRKRNVLGIDFFYIFIIVVKYEFNNFENIKVFLGNYKVGNYIFILFVLYNFLDRKLDIVKDIYRIIVLGLNRFVEFNRFENIVYNNILERRVDLNLFNDNEIYRVGFGKIIFEIWLREGFFDGIYRKYENKLKFYEV